MEAREYAGRSVRLALEMVMNSGVGPILQSPAGPALAMRRPERPAAQAPQALRLPEDRAFEVATINKRLARMAERAASGGADIKV